MQFDQLKRREFMTLLGGAAAWPLAARAQQSVPKMPRIGIIDPGAMWAPFRQALRELGYVEGRNIAIEYRSTGERPDRLVAAAMELAQLPVDVIVSYGSPATQAQGQARLAAFQQALQQLGWSDGRNTPIDLRCP